MPMRTIDEQDVPPDRFENEMGPQLRDAGFDAAVLVMLGGPGASMGQRGGFWARFVMAAPGRRRRWQRARVGALLARGCPARSPTRGR